MCFLSVYTLLNVVGYYDWSVLSTSVHVRVGFKKKIGWGVGGWGELYSSFLEFWNFYNFAKPLTSLPHCIRSYICPLCITIICCCFQLPVTIDKRFDKPRPGPTLSTIHWRSHWSIYGTHIHVSEGQLSKPLLC